MASEVKVADELKALLKQAGMDPDWQAKIESDVWYTLILEKGSSKQAPQGIVGKFTAEYNRHLREAVEKAVERELRKKKPDLQAAIQRGFREGVKQILRAIEARTAIKTGKARSSWRAKLPNGRAIRAIKVKGDPRKWRRERRKHRRKET